MKPAFISRHKWLLVVVAVVVIAACFLLNRIRDYDSSIALLLQLEHARGAAWAGRIGEHAVAVHDETISFGEQSIHARLYVPEGKAAPPALVLVHGVHRLGINDPRLVTLANAFAERGILVLTPQLKSLEDYRIDPSEITTVGESAKYLQAQTGQRVALLGISFSGSLSLLAAAKPEYSQAIACVIAVGGYDDLQHVARFLFSGKAELPDGSFRRQSVEQYGALVLVYAHPEEYFEQADVVAAQTAIRLWLQEQFAQARIAEQKMTPAGRAQIEDMFRFQMRTLQPEFEDALTREAAEMQRVSPHGQLKDLQAPVYLLHGTDDEVIPSSETQWLERDVPKSCLRRVLITPAFGHVDASAHIGLQDQWELASFMASIFNELRHEPTQGDDLRSR